MSLGPFAFPDVPLEEPVLVFTLALAVFLVAPLLIRRAGLPGIVGIVLLGAALGPGGIGIIEEVAAIELLGLVGLIYLLFTVGLDMDIRGFKQSPDSAAFFGLMSFGIPFVVGSVGGHYLIGLDPLAAILLAAVFASHTLLAYPIVNRLGINKNPAVTAVFGGILFTDTLALTVLAIVMGAEDGAFGIGLFADVALSLFLLFGLTLLVVPRASRWFFRSFSEESYFEFLFVLVAFFLAASLAEMLNLDGILGAFIAGIALNRQIPEGGTLHNRITFVGNAFFIPFFLLYVGTLVDFRVILDGLNTLSIAAFIIVTMFVCKFIAAWLVGYVKNYNTDERTVIFGLSTGQAAAALAITLIGFEAGLFDTAVLNAVVLLLLVTAIISPWITERAAGRMAVSAEIGDEDRDAMDPRILLPLSHSAELQRRLLELAFVLKGGPADEPVHVLTVVQPDGEDIEEQVTKARAELADLEEISSAAEVPIQVESRVNHNIGSGISQAAIEEEANLVIMGWDAGQPFRHRIFGSIIDHVIDQLQIPVMIARLGHPVNTTKRMFILLPRGIIHHDGFFESLYLFKSLAERLGSEVMVIAIDDNTDAYERVFGYVEPELDASFDAIDGWQETLSYLDEELTAEDLVTVIGAERGGVGWHRALENLPQQLRDLPPHSFLIVHPRENEPGYDRSFLRFQ